MKQAIMGRVLIVDDEDDLRQVLNERLSLQGYETVACADGEAGLEALHAEPFDVLLTDLMMPGMSGLDLLRTGQEVDPNLVGILMTGQATVSTAVEALKAGAFDYVAKPFKLTTLRPILDRAMELRKLRMENVQLQETVSIYELSSAVSLALDPVTILENVGNAALKLCGADEASILLQSEDGLDLYIAVVLGRSSEEFLGIRVPPDGVARWVAENQEAVSIHGELNDPRFPGSIYPRDMTSASVPMLAGGHLLGVLNVNASERTRPFTPGQVKALTILASTGAAALQNARLYQHVAKSERRFRGTFQQSAMGIGHVSPEGQWLRVNGKLCEILGYEEQELLGSSRQTITHPEDWHPKERLCSEVVGGQRSGFQMEQRCIRKSGEVIWTQLTVSAVRDPVGNLEFLVKVLDDITDRKRADLELLETNRRLTQALEDLQRTQSQLLTQERLRALGEMASGIAHDFNNALTPIVGFTELLLDPTASAENPERLESFLRMINTSAKDAASIVQRLREFYREHDESDHFQEVDLSEIANQALNLTQPKWRDQALASGRHVDIERRLDTTSPIQGDPAQLRELLTNLIFNAVDAMPQGGRLLLSTYKREGSVVLEVTDTGIGMTDEVCHRCLEPFFTTKGDHGTGLGLPMVFGIVKRHGGEVAIDSQVGEGTTIRISLPERPEGETSLKAPAPAFELMRKLRVLVVDDEAIIRNVTTSYLIADGHQVETAASGAEALEKYQPHRFDLVITDQAMPGMSGEQLAKTIKEQDQEQSILLLTGFGTLMQARGEIPTGIDKVLGKPVTLSDLRGAVAQLTAKK